MLSRLLGRGTDAQTEESRGALVSRAEELGRRIQHELEQLSVLRVSLEQSSTSLEENLSSMQLHLARRQASPDILATTYRGSGLVTQGHIVAALHRITRRIERLEASQSSLTALLRSIQSRKYRVQASRARLDQLKVEWDKANLTIAADVNQAQTAIFDVGYHLSMFNLGWAGRM